MNSIVINSKQLSAAVKALAPIAAKGYFTDILLEVESNTATITATSLDVTAKKTIELPFANSANFATAVPSQLLNDLLQKLPDQQLTVELLENDILKITWANGSAKLSCTESGNFPSPPIDEITTDSLIVLKAADFKTVINKTLWATSNDELRPAFTGVYIKNENNNLIFCATDATKLIKLTIPSNIGANIGSNIEAIIPSAAIKILRAIIADSDSGETITLGLDEKNAVFTFEGFIFTCRLIDAKFPPYKSIIPTNNDKLAAIDIAPLKSALRRVSIFSNSNSLGVALELSNNEIKLTAQDIDFQREAAETMTCEFDSSEFTIKFNYKNVLAALDILNSDICNFSFSEPNRAALIAENNNNYNLTILLMPII